MPAGREPDGQDGSLTRARYGRPFNGLDFRPFICQFIIRIVCAFLQGEGIMVDKRCGKLC